MTWYRKKPIVIEAMQYDGVWPNAKLILDWMDRSGSSWGDFIHSEFYINTLEGKMLVAPGDWVIKGIKGEFYPCKPDIFEATYEVVLDA